MVYMEQTLPGLLLNPVSVSEAFCVKTMEIPHTPPTPRLICKQDCKHNHKAKSRPG